MEQQYGTPVPAEEQTAAAGKQAEQRAEIARTIRRRRRIAAAVIAAAAVILRFAAPQTVEHVRGQVQRALTGNVDFAAAAETLGRGLSGELGLEQALEQAYTYAFSPQWDDAVPAGGNGGGK